MSEANYQSVPWISSAEWVFVRDALFSGVPRRQRRAIDRIDAWRCRYNGFRSIGRDMLANAYPSLDRFLLPRRLRSEGALGAIRCDHLFALVAVVVVVAICGL